MFSLSSSKYTIRDFRVHDKLRPSRHKTAQYLRINIDFYKTQKFSRNVATMSFQLIEPYIEQENGRQKRKFRLNESNFDTLMNTLDDEETDIAITSIALDSQNNKSINKKSLYNSVKDLNKN